MCRGGFPQIFRYLAFLPRSVLVYPGEIFRFHFPEALDETNCIPTSEAMPWALPIDDGAYAFPEVDETRVISAASPAATDCKSEPRETSKKDRVALTLYAPALARDIPRAQSVAQYIHVSALLAGTSKSLAISDSSNIVLGVHVWSIYGNHLCVEKILRQDCDAHRSADCSLVHMPRR
jgi:hypothetical protein